VTLCVKGGHCILWEQVGANCVRPKLSNIGAVVEKYIKNINVSYDNIFVDKYVIMPNHIHMIIVIVGGDAHIAPKVKENNYNGTMWASSPTRIGIPSVIRSLKTLTTKQIGFSIWQRSFHDHIIRSENEHLQIWQYIDENPRNLENDEYY